MASAPGASVVEPDLSPTGRFVVRGVPVRLLPGFAHMSEPKPRSPTRRVAATRQREPRSDQFTGRALVEITVSPREAEQPFADLESLDASSIPLPQQAPSSAMPSSRVPVPEPSLRFENMGKKATSRHPNPPNPQLVGANARSPTSTWSSPPSLNSLPSSNAGNASWSSLVSLNGSTRPPPARPSRRRRAVASSRGRNRWVSYLRVSTAEQAERELSLTAQRRAVVEFATRHDATIDSPRAPC